MSAFPDPRRLPEGQSVLKAGGSLTPDSLAEAYSIGIFPWPAEGMPVLWHCPDPRGVLDFPDFRIPPRLARKLKGSGLEISVNAAFPEVIRACAAVPRAGQAGTWITPEIIRAYTAFHAEGYAHSLECWREGSLVGGLYGVYIDGIFSGESMFHTETDASKLCFVRLVELLRSRGLTWIDIQMVTPVTERFGGRYIPRKEYFTRLDLPARARLPKKINF